MTIELEQKQIPVLLLTGYLGSGKTTLLNRILSNRKGIKFAVIVNDIGEVNIDADLIEKGGIVGQTDDSLVALQNGCICCTLKMDLVAQLSEISAMRKFDYIVIEASGICEPAPIAQTISTLPMFGCNIVLLNKAAEVSADELGKLRGIIASLNPQARILDCNYGDVDLDEIIYTGMFDFDRVATSAAWIAAIEGEDEEEEAEGEALEYGIDTYVYAARPALDMNKFDYMVARKWPANIIRAKGLCYFSDDTDKCYLFEQSGRQKSIRDAGLWYATMEEEDLNERLERDPILRRDWDPVYGDRMQKIVFIGQHLDKPGIKKLMDDCLAE